MIKVLNVLSCLSNGGTESFVMNNYRNIDREKIKIDFFIFTHSKPQYIEEITKNGNNIYFGVTPGIKRLYKFFKIFSKILKNGKYDVVHCHVNIQNFVPIICSKMCGVKIRISHSHATNSIPKTVISKMGFYFKRILINSFSNVKLACSEEAGKSLYGNKIFLKQGKIIRNGIDVSRFLRKEKSHHLLEEFNIDDNCDLILGNITRFDDNKNQMFILSVFKKVLRNHPSAILVLGGTNGGLLDKVQKEAKKLNIADNVRFIGERTDVAECLSIFDIYIFPSKNEGFGIAVLEAQAAGKVCIASEFVTKKTDMGLSLNYYLPLDESIWADTIDDVFRQSGKITSDRIKDAFIDNGFDILSSAKELEKTYQKMLYR